MNVWKYTHKERGNWILTKVGLLDLKEELVSIIGEEHNRRRETGTPESWESVTVRGTGIVDEGLVKRLTESQYKKFSVEV